MWFSLILTLNFPLVSPLSCTEFNSIYSTRLFLIPKQFFLQACRSKTAISIAVCEAKASYFLLLLHHVSLSCIFTQIVWSSQVKSRGHIMLFAFSLYFLICLVYFSVHSFSVAGAPIASLKLVVCLMYREPEVEGLILLCQCFLHVVSFLLPSSLQFSCQIKAYKKVFKKLSHILFQAHRNSSL